MGFASGMDPLAEIQLSQIARFWSLEGKKFKYVVVNFWFVYRETLLMSQGLHNIKNIKGAILI